MHSCIFDVFVDITRAKVDVGEDGDRESPAGRRSALKHRYCWGSASIETTLSYNDLDPIGKVVQSNIVTIIDGADDVDDLGHVFTFYNAEDSKRA